MLKERRSNVRFSDKYFTVDFITIKERFLRTDTMLIPVIKKKQSHGLYLYT